ncbi:FAD:protein FMN transferase [Tersicoccus sp. MR15.9]|uniref:FAD:protein FMN transferase n=1 Tax=Tersicoccus mangrovi TaxID=3121635 RepID=UPI002FE6ACD8
MSLAAFGLPAVLPGSIRTVRAWVRQVMGLPVSVHVRAADPARPDIDAAVDALFADLERADAVFSLWRQNSDLSRIRRGVLAEADADPWIAEVRDLTERAVDATEGLFTTDLTGPDGARGWDPTGVVKGWAVERAAAHLRAVPGIAFSINAGGDLVCGRGPASSLVDPHWRIGVEKPGAPGAFSTVVTVTEGALATSGTAARGDHIVDPRTGAPVAGGRTSVTVVGPDLTWADVWATACFVDPHALGQAGPEWSGYRVANVTD